MIVSTAIISPILVFGLVYYHKKKMDHKEILAAIEKGVPVSELSIGTKKQNKNNGPEWIQDQSKGVTLLIIGIGIGFAFLLFLGPLHRAGTMNVMWIIPVVFLGNGIGLMIRAKMRRKYEKPETPELPTSEVYNTDKQ